MFRKIHREIHVQESQGLQGQDCNSTKKDAVIFYQFCKNTFLYKHLWSPLFPNVAELILYSHLCKLMQILQLLQIPLNP